MASGSVAVAKKIALYESRRWSRFVHMTKYMDAENEMTVSKEFRIWHG